MSGENQRNSFKDDFEQPVYGFDITYGQLLLGQAAIDFHIETGGHPFDVRPLASLLLTDEVDGIPADHFEMIDPQPLSRDEYIAYGKWLHQIVSKANGVLSKRVIRRARILGLGPGEKPITHPNMFKDFSSFYIAVGANNSLRARRFQDWTPQDFANDLSDFKDKPTESDIDQRAKLDPSHPSTTVMTRSGVSLRTILELAGWPDIYSMSNDDIVSHGVKFMIANRGLIPTARGTDYLSGIKKGPSSGAINYRFEGKFLEFKKRVINAYKIEIASIHAHRQKMLKEINNTIHQGSGSSILPEIFEGVKNEDELVLRYAKYLVLNDLLPENFIDTKISIVLLKDRTFIGAIMAIARRSDLAITPGDIEYAATILNVFNDIWPPDYSSLKLPEEIIQNSKRLEANPADF